MAKLPMREHAVNLALPNKHNRLQSRGYHYKYMTVMCFRFHDRGSLYFTKTCAYYEEITRIPPKVSLWAVRWGGGGGGGKSN